MAMVVIAAKRSDSLLTSFGALKLRWQRSPKSPALYFEVGCIAHMCVTTFVKLRVIIIILLSVVIMPGWPWHYLRLAIWQKSKAERVRLRSLNLKATRASRMTRPKDKEDVGKTEERSGGVVFVVKVAVRYRDTLGKRSEVENGPISCH